MSEKRHATRYLLPLEMAVAVQLVALAVAGMWRDTALFNVLALTAENSMWSALLGSIGVAWLSLAAWEWLCGARWMNGHLRLVLSARKWLALLAGFAWSYALFTMLAAPDGWRVIEIALESVPFAGFAAWSWWVNYRTGCVLDPTMSTARLERSLEAKRTCW